MKKIAFTFACIAGISLISMAQSKGTKPNSSKNGQHQTPPTGAHNNASGEHKDTLHHSKATPEERAAKLTQYMTTTLSLTPDQQSKISALNIKKAQEIEKIRSSNKGNMEAAKPALKTAKDEYNTSLNAILTADQKTKWEAIKKQKKEEYQKNKAAGTKPKEGDLSPEDIE